MDGKDVTEHSARKLQDMGRVSRKTSLTKFKAEITSTIFPDHENVKPEINYKKKTKIHKYVKIKQHATE